jgi:predicted RNA-binding Zn ribbon-like protein
MVSLAPDTLRLVQSFASTLGADDGTDLLRTREDAVAWLRAAALLDDSAGLSNSEHAALLRLRESLRDVLASHADGPANGRADADGRADAEAAARLTKALADGRLVITVAPGSAIQLVSAARASYPCIVAAIAVAIAEAAADGTWLRLKRCRAPGCGQVFYDDSPAAAAQHCPAHAG